VVAFLVYNENVFQNRVQAGKLLSEKLKHLKGEDVVVLAIPRGGVVVGAEIAKSLSCPLDIIVTKKIGAPGNPELAIGAVGRGGVRVIDWGLARRTGADEEYVNQKTKQLNNEITMKEKRLRDERKPLEIEGKIVILTDDGIATGATAEAAIKVIQSQTPKKLIVAMPVAPPESVKKLKSLVDEVICLSTPALFWAVGQFYQGFEQVGDEEVIRILNSISS